MHARAERGVRNSRSADGQHPHARARRGVRRHAGRYVGFAGRHVHGGAWIGDRRDDHRVRGQTPQCARGAATAERLRRCKIEFLPMPATVAPSALAVPHSKIREIADLAMGMDGVLKLYFGESNIPTPDYIKRAAQKAMADGFTYYTENAGLPSLRKALARYYSELHGVELDPAAEIAVTASGVQALNVAIRCMLDPGDEGIVLTPSWPNGSAIIQMANATCHEIPYSFS